jgi:alpha-tubulin suppressor-like RCC1 family protein
MGTATQHRVGISARRAVIGVLGLSVVTALFATPARAVTAGAVYAWFDNDAGQLGIGQCCVQFDSTTPVKSMMPSGTTSIATAAGQSHSLVVTSTGLVYAFGFNGRGQLGDGTKTSHDAPVQTSMPAGVMATAVAAGWDHSLALTSTGAVYAWGYNAFGQLGNGTTKNQLVPVLVHMPAGVTAIAAGQYHCLALTSTGAVYAWGFNGFGQLGNGTTNNASLPQLVPLPAGVKATAVGAGDNHSLVVTSTGAVYAFGKNNFGQLGNGTTNYSNVPVLVRMPAGVKATAVVAGGVSPTAKVPGADYSLALTPKGHVYAWGGGGNGQLGNGKTTNSSVPVFTKLPSGVVATQIGAGPNFGHALTSTGDVYYWGAQSNGHDQHLVPAATVLPSGLHAVEASAGPDGEQIVAIFV